MRVPDSILKTALFIGVLTGEGPRFVGTGFIVTVEYGRGHVFELKSATESMTVRAPFAFLVTAKHIVESLDGSDLYVRANAADGSGAKTVNLGCDVRWWYHPTDAESVDAAVTLFPPEVLFSFDYAPIPVSFFALEATIEERGLGIGDDVFVSGLFTKVMADTENIPIIRTGTVAMMPKGKIPFKGGKMNRAYLVETHSIGGLSGSPVFIRETVAADAGVRFRPGFRLNAVDSPTPKIEGMESVELKGVGRFHLFGSMIGHWEVPEGYVPDHTEAANMGISPVVPAQNIYEILTQPELLEIMNQINSERSVKEPRVM